MNERIKKIRKSLGFTQQEFADKLNIKRGAIANYEIGRNEPIDAVVSLICRVFGANEDWLRNGGPDEDMFKKDFEVDELSDYCAEITEGKDPFIADMLLKYKSLSPQHKKAIWEIYEELTKKKED